MGPEGGIRLEVFHGVLHDHLSAGDHGPGDRDPQVRIIASPPARADEHVFTRLSAELVIQLFNLLGQRRCVEFVEPLRVDPDDVLKALDGAIAHAFIRKKKEISGVQIRGNKIHIAAIHELMLDLQEAKGGLSIVGIGIQIDREFNLHRGLHGIANEIQSLLQDSRQRERIVLENIPEIHDARPWNIKSIVDPIVIEIPYGGAVP